MATKIRLKRMGKKFYAFYRVVIMDSRTKRDGRAIEEIGTYNPNTQPSTIVIDSERAQYWLGVGAQPTERMQKMLSALGLCSAPVIREQPKKSAPKAKAQERMKEKAEKAAAAAEAAAQAAAEPASEEAQA